MEYAPTDVPTDAPTVGETAAHMTRAACLDKAKACATGHREQDYGKPEDNFAVIARLWSAYLDCEIGRQDVANMMILQKMGRITSGTGTADSYVDIAGYAACGCEIATAE
ncbi:MAG: DUF6378 domain-containing protein [Clostridiales bacterium]|nr:DUF6378 domain-containing protein [Clostridiales bacterium]